MRRLRRREPVWRHRLGRKDKDDKKREDRKGEHFVRWRGGRGRSRGQSRGNWYCYHGQLDLADVLLAAFPPTSWIAENTKKEQCTFPSMFTLVLLFYSSFFSPYKAQTHIRLTGVAGAGNKQLNLPNKRGGGVMEGCPSHSEASSESGVHI